MLNNSRDEEAASIYFLLVITYLIGNLLYILAVGFIPLLILPQLNGIECVFLPQYIWLVHGGIMLDQFIIPSVAAEPFTVPAVSW